jgi:hypothetical protein
VPRHIRDFIEKQVNGAYPGAEIRVTDEPNIFSEGGKVAFAQLKLKDAEYFPIKTFKDLPTDSLSLTTSALSKMQEGEGAILQFLIQPEDEGWQKRALYLASTKKKEADHKRVTHMIQNHWILLIPKRASLVSRLYVWFLLQINL